MKPQASIVRRLVLALAVAVLAAFAVSDLMFYNTIESELRKRAQATVMGRYTMVEHLVQESLPDETGLALREALEDALLEHGGLRIWVRDAQGRLVFGNRWLDAPATGRFIRVRDDRGVELDYYSGRVHYPGGHMLVAVARDPRPDQSLLSGLAWRLTAECLMGALLAALLANWIVRRGLRPVQRLSRQTAAVSLDGSSAGVREEDLPIELQPLARNFNAAVARMREAYRQVEAFNANVAHELRTPIANLSGAMQVALSRPRTADEWRTQVQTSLENVERLSAIVNDMLFLARADAGQVQQRRDRVDVHREAEKVVDYFEAALEDARLTVRIAGTAAAHADAALLRRAFSNLLANALRHAAAGSEILVSIEKTGTHVRCAVTNVGASIDREHIPRLFDRFFRIEASRSAGGRGSGLGLSIVRAVARLHDGDVFATSQNGRTTIGLTIAAPS